VRSFLLNEQDTDEIYVAIENLIFALGEILENREIREEYPGDYDKEEGDDKKEDGADYSDVEF
jgi:hypothetical protein